ncbi:MAG: hypothetical protein QW666_02210 [Candidatus Woesearchaeota archaeon]
MKLLEIYRLLAEHTGKAAEEISALPHNEKAKYIKEYIDSLGIAEQEAVYKEILKPENNDQHFESLDAIANMLEYHLGKNISTDFRKVTGAMQKKIAAREQRIEKLEQRIKTYAEAKQKPKQPITNARFMEILAKKIKKNPELTKNVRQILKKQKELPEWALPETCVYLWGKSSSNKSPDEWISFLAGKNTALASASDLYEYAKTLLVWSISGSSKQIEKAYAKAEEFRKAETIVTSTKIIFNNLNQGRISDYQTRTSERLTRGAFPFEHCDAEDSIKLTLALQKTSFMKDLFDTKDTDITIKKALCFLFGTDSANLKIIGPRAENKREQSYVTFIKEGENGIISIENPYMGKAYAVK